MPFLRSMEMPTTSTGLVTLPSTTCYRSPHGAGPGDIRKTVAVWRGSMGGKGGMTKGRQALLDLGVQAPDLVDAGSADWNESLYGPADGRQKPSITFAEQATPP